MTRLTVVGLALLFGLLIGLTHEPDSGTEVSVGPPDVAAAVVGPNHAKPLPRVPSVVDLLALSQAFAPAVLALMLVIRPAWARTSTVEHDDDRRPADLRSLARSRRGPPALA